MSQIWESDAVVPVSIVKILDENIENIAKGDLVSVSGLSKGKGFQGVVKRHGFRGGPKTHGQKNRLRAPGSIGSTAPQRVMKGKRMAGHMGQTKVTVKNLKIALVKPESKEVYIKGAVPGMRGNILLVTK